VLDYITQCGGGGVGGTLGAFAFLFLVFLEECLCMRSVSKIHACRAC
jgi:hypothetical protein